LDLLFFRLIKKEPVNNDGGIDADSEDIKSEDKVMDGEEVMNDEVVIDEEEVEKSAYGVEDPRGPLAQLYK
jgi:hypothetical protein